MQKNSAFSFLVSASMLLTFWSERMFCEDAKAREPIKTTISDLASDPQKFDGKLVCVPAVVVPGWEGDNFLVEPSKPVPLDMPSQGDPAAVWFYSNPHAEQRDKAATEQKTNDCRGSKGYFHFIKKPEIVNGVFDPGSLQLEFLYGSAAADEIHSLAQATLSGDVDETRKILHTDVSVSEKYKSILLFLAADSGREDFAEELLAAGADPKLTTAGGETSLMKAAWNCNFGVAKLLLSHGAPVNAVDMGGNTALMLAAQTCHDGQMVNLLLSGGADPNFKSKDDFTALMCAAGNPINVEALLKAGADPTVKSSFGNTAESDNCDRGEAGHAQACSIIREALKNSAGHAQE